MKRTLAALAALLIACGSSSDPEDASTDEPSDLVDSDTRDTSSEPDAEPRDIPQEEVTLGPCGVYCMGENVPCPEGAFCEYGVLDPEHICTDDGCGICAWIPLECEPEDRPDCGCDGHVYPNPCERRRAHVGPDPSWLSCPHPDPDDLEPEPEPSEEPDI
jgi:hypothetical protein